MLLTVVFRGNKEDKEKIEIKTNQTVSQLLTQLCINPETVVVRRGKQFLLDDDKLKSNDRIEIINVGGRHEM